jgi:hypothetical protein
MEPGETFAIYCNISTGYICVDFCKKTLGKCGEEEKELYEYYFSTKISVTTGLQYLNIF